MNILWRFRTHNALYNQVKELQSALEHMEEELDLQIEKLQDENEYLKDELSWSRVRSNRLDEEIKTVRERDYKDIYPGLQAAINQLGEENRELRQNFSKIVEGAKDFFCEQCKEDCAKENVQCSFEDFQEFIDLRIKKDEVPTETTSEDS